MRERLLRTILDFLDGMLSAWDVLGLFDADKKDGGPTDAAR